MKPNTEFPIVSGRRQVVLHVRTLMASRGIRSSAALQRMLISDGVQISNAQLLRIIDNKSLKVNMDVINGLLNVFQCSVHDLVGEQAASEPQEAANDPGDGFDPHLSK